MKASKQQAPPDPELLEHIESLGLKSVEAYREWCTQNGFSRKLAKHWKQRCRERFHAHQAVAEERLKTRKREKRRLRDVIKGICDGRVGQHDVTQPHLARLCNLVRPHKGTAGEPQVNRHSLRELLSHIRCSGGKFFEGTAVVDALGDCPGNTYLEALALCAAHHRAWLRPVNDWKPRSHSPRRQFASLLRHLFVRYDDMPAFFDAVWFAGRAPQSAEHRRWYLHVGRGQNIRHCLLPISYTKKMAHHFMQAPDDATIEQALRWGQVHGLGGDERLARALFETLLTEHASFSRDEFWSSVIRWFIEHPLLDRAHVGPVIDYLYHQRFAPEYVFIAPGRREQSQPPQPNLSMKGRTPESLLRQVDAWHGRLANDNTRQLSQWPPSGVEGFEFLEGSADNRNLKCWTIRELLSSKALTAEGRRMKHCVATYASSCSGGISSIWTLEVESFVGRTKVLTIEIRNSARLICQARGKANRLPTTKERSMLRRWATQAGLRIADYV